MIDLDYHLTPSTVGTDDSVTEDISVTLAQKLYKQYKISSTVTYNKEHLFQKISMYLDELEHSLTPTLLEVEKVQGKLELLPTTCDEYEEGIYRVRKLQNIIKATDLVDKLDEQIDSSSVAILDTLKQAKRSLASCSRSPLYQQLKQRLTSLEREVANRGIKEEPLPSLPLLERFNLANTEKEYDAVLIEVAGDDYINLGKEGRYQVIAEFYEQKKNNYTDIKEVVSELNPFIERYREKLQAVVKAKDVNEIVASLNALELDPFCTFSSEVQAEVAEYLIAYTRKYQMISLLKKAIKEAYIKTQLVNHDEDEEVSLLALTEETSEGSMTVKPTNYNGALNSKSLLLKVNKKQEHSECLTFVDVK